MAVVSLVSFSAFDSYALTDNLGVCSKIKNPSDRLSCFDNVSSEKMDDVAVPIPLDMSVKSKASKKAVVIVKPEAVPPKVQKQTEAVKAVEPMNSAHAQEHAERMAVEKLNEKIPSLPPESRLKKEDVVAKKVTPKQEVRSDEVDLVQNLGLTVDDVKSPKAVSAKPVTKQISAPATKPTPQKDLTSTADHVVVKAHHSSHKTKDGMAEQAEFLPEVVCADPVIEPAKAAGTANETVAEAAASVQDKTKNNADVKQDDHAEHQPVAAETVLAVTPVDAPGDVVTDTAKTDSAKIDDAKVDAGEDVQEMARIAEKQLDEIAEELEEYVSEEEAVLESKSAIEAEEVVEWMPPAIETETGGMFEVSDLTGGRMAGGKKFVQTSIRRDVIRPQYSNSETPRASLQQASYGEKVLNASRSWHLFEEMNPFDDTNTLSLLLEAHGKSERWGDVPYLVLRCKSKRMDLYVVWHDQIRESLEVVSRIGMQPAESAHWSLSTDGRASFYPHNPISFIKRLKKSERFVVQATPYNKNPVTAVFDLADLKTAIKPLEKNCHWR